MTNHRTIPPRPPRPWSAVVLVVLFVLVPLASHGQHFQAYLIDSMFFSVGAITPVPCNDGTFVGGALYCNRSSEDGNASLRRPCGGDIYINRSYDGGVTWVRERTESPSHSSGNIVRLRDGVLMTADASMRHVFLQSTDHGRTWHRAIISDTTRGDAFADSLVEITVGDKLTRDERGVLSWWYGFDNIVHLSLDDGRSIVWLRLDTGASSGDWSVNSRTWQQVTSSGALATEYFATPDYGRTYIFWDPESSPFDLRDAAFVDGFAIGTVYSSYVRGDSLVLFARRHHRQWPLVAADEAGFVVLYTEPGTRRFRVDSTRMWEKWFSFPWSSSCLRREIGALDDPVFDSLGRMHYAGFTVHAVDRDTCEPWTYRHVDGTLDTLPFPDTVRWTHGGWQTPATAFYDLDGNLHSNSRSSFHHADHVRPVSILDKLHTCGGMQFLVGGGIITDVVIDSVGTQNARVTSTIAANRRMVVIDVQAIDSSQAVTVCFTVGDSLKPSLTHCDSTNIPTPAPTFRVLGAREVGQVGFNYDIVIDPYDGWVANDNVTRPSDRYLGIGKTAYVRPDIDFFLVARDRNGCMRCSDTVYLPVVSVGDESGPSAAMESVAMALAPNPATDEVTVSIAGTGTGAAPYTLEVSTVLGQVVERRRGYLVGGMETSEVVSVASLPRGAYAVRVAVAGTSESTMLIVR